MREDPSDRFEVKDSIGMCINPGPGRAELGESVADPYQRQLGYITLRSAYSIVRLTDASQSACTTRRVGPE